MGCWNVAFVIFTILTTHILFQQMQLLSAEPILVLALVQSTWIMLAVLAVRQDSLTALEARQSPVSVVTQKMLEYDVKVWKNGALIVYFSSV